MPLDDFRAQIDPRNRPTFEQLGGCARFENDVWLNQRFSEHVILSKQYDFTRSLLHFDDAEPRAKPLEEDVEDIADRLQRQYAGQSARR